VVTRYPKLQLSRLRRIGWDEWDPIGLASPAWDDRRKTGNNEYDPYLLQVVAMLQGGKATQEASAYLDEIASEYIGLGPRSAAGREASARTVEAIAAYLRTLPDGPLSAGQA
jgi:hypothetical protein